jgi:hypothetical protein
MVKGVEVWVLAQPQLGVQTDIPEDAVDICKHQLSVCERWVSCCLCIHEPLQALPSSPETAVRSSCIVLSQNSISISPYLIPFLSYSRRREFIDPKCS